MKYTLFFCVVFTFCFQSVLCQGFNESSLKGNVKSSESQLCYLSTHFGEVVIEDSCDHTEQYVFDINGRRIRYTVLSDGNSYRAHFESSIDAASFFVEYDYDIDAQWVKETKYSLPDSVLINMSIEYSDKSGNNISTESYDSTGTLVSNVLRQFDNQNNLLEYQSFSSLRSTHSNWLPDGSAQFNIETDNKIPFLSF